MSDATTAVREYKKRRREVTTRELSAATGDVQKLNSILRERRKLARIYAEDGAHHTAWCIRNIDLPLIRAALAEAA